ncbi:MAG: MFS transporter [Proteobacteria bacterium]|nr:MFS transporter [Pseudomonadota bacterium]
MNDLARRGGGVALIVALCFVAAMCEGFDVQSAGVAAAGIGHDFKPTPGQLGLFFAAANLGLVIGALVGGPLADRVGRKPVLVVSLLAFGACSVLNGLAPSVPALTVARLATGLGLGGAMPNMIALVTDVTAARARNAVIGFTFVGMPVGGSLASLLVLGLGPSRWRELFFVGGAAPVVVAFLLIVALREGPAGGTAAREAGPILEVFSEGRLPRTLVIWAGFLAAALTLHLMLNWLPLLLQARGLSKSDAALAQTAFNLLGAGGAFLAGWSLDTRARPWGVAASVAAIPVALLLVAEAPAQLLGTAFAAGLLGAGVLALNVILYGAAGDCYPARVRGAGLGAAVGATRVGALAGPTLAAVLLNAGRTPEQVLISLLPVVLAAGACAAWLTWLRLAGRVAVAA